MTGLHYRNVFIRDDMGYEQLHLENEDTMVPHAIIKLKRLTIIWLYNEFTQVAYSNNQPKVTKKRKVERINDILTKTAEIVGHVIIPGDANIDTKKQNSNVRAYKTNCLELNLTHYVKEPTKNQAFIDHILTKKANPKKNVDTWD